MMSIDEWEKYHYSNLPIFKQPVDRLRIMGCISLLKDTYAFGVNILDKDLWFYLSMTSPEVLVKYGKDEIDKKDIDDVMYAISDCNLWPDLILSIVYCAKSDKLTKKYASIDITKIPVQPPDYRKILEDIS